MKKFKFNPEGVCCKEMYITLTEDNIVEDVVFVGGCPGNTLGVGALAKGKSAEEVAERLQNITCGNKNTSCPAQLSLALKAVVGK